MCGSGRQVVVENSAYKALHELHYISQSQDVFSLIWDLKVPTKVILFCLQAFEE